MATTLIGLIGLKRSGKDTYAARLVAEHGFTRLALADPMRDAALALDPIVNVYDAGDEWGGIFTERLSEVVARVGWDRAKEEYPEVRRTLERLGTEVGRDIFGEDSWLGITDAKVSATPGPVVITDVRFPNEYEWIKRRGGVLVRVIRPGVTLAAEPHSSELLAADLDGYPADRTVINGSTITDLHVHADDIVEVLR
ncbi:MAG: hypothetical protein JWN35_2792 [Frankiales bacterium]|jgi:hypothetical protein|nr:hypothetical protein [Frankiales bacterium]